MIKGSYPFRLRFGLYESDAFLTRKALALYKKRAFLYQCSLYNLATARQKLHVS